MSSTRKRLIATVLVLCCVVFLVYPSSPSPSRIFSSSNRAHPCDTASLIKDVYINKNSTIHPSAVSDFIHASHNFGTPSKQVQDAGRERILYSSVWLGGELPKYAQLSLWSMSRKPAFDVSILVDAKLQICTNPPQFVKDAENLRIVCLNLESIHALIVDLFCTGWKCNKDEWYRIYDVLSSKMIEYPRTVSYWKPMMGALHRKQLGAYDKWAWFDLDTVHGDYDRLFPWSDVRNHNILTFSYNHVWQKLYTHGQLSMFDATDYFIFAWMRTRFGTSAKEFLGNLKEVGWHKMLSGFDEGAFARVLLHDPKVSWMVRSGMHIADSQLWDDLTVRIRADSASLLVLPDQNNTASFEKHLLDDLLPSPSRRSIYDTSEVTDAETSNDCEDSEWIPAKERFCAVKYTTDHCPSFGKKSKKVRQINTPCENILNHDEVVGQEILFIHLHQHKKGIEENLAISVLPDEKQNLLLGQGFAKYYDSGR